MNDLLVSIPLFESWYYFIILVLLPIVTLNKNIILVGYLIALNLAVNELLTSTYKEHYYSLVILMECINLLIYSLLIDKTRFIILTMLSLFSVLINVLLSTNLYLWPLLDKYYDMINIGLIELTILVLCFNFPQKKTR